MNDLQEQESWLHAAEEALNEWATENPYEVENGNGDQDKCEERTNAGRFA